eukprot:TRINITY_DN3366_c0_g2_i2.p1 TRINITY_DN3366_c0_g2~~TRINITY_DN3366_c0_g2_i2.p1  ORF type:complete len:161 (-),score=53.05 TRINITY_DN3366_c0_g2_i2:228-710(-)
MGGSLRKRRGRKVNTVKVKEKRLMKQHMNPKLIRDKELRKSFDPKKTLKQNMEATDMKELYKNVLPKKIPKKAAHPLKINEDEKPILTKLIEKHGDKYDKMGWDIKINVMQWTAKQCENKVKAYKAGAFRSEAAEIMSGHGMDLRKPLYGAAKQRNVFGH